jgi:RNA polymerase sigma-70 factor (ECF subfamily)
MNTWRMDDFDERALIERCRSGDDRAFGELVDRYKDLVYGLVWRMTSERSRVDDMAQDVFLKVHRGLPYFRGEAKLSTWITASFRTRARRSVGGGRLTCRSSRAMVTAGDRTSRRALTPRLATSS